MIAIPEVTRIDVVFGNIKHLPKYDTLSEDFQRGHHHACKAVQSWFFSGINPKKHAIDIKGTEYAPREGVEMNKALAAIQSCLCSFEPKHEHKIAGCGYMFDQWFKVLE